MHADRSARSQLGNPLLASLFLHLALIAAAVGGYRQATPLEMLSTSIELQYLDSGARQESLGQERGARRKAADAVAVPAPIRPLPFKGRDRVGMGDFSRKEFTSPPAASKVAKVTGLAAAGPAGKETGRAASFRAVPAGIYEATGAKSATPAAPAAAAPTVVALAASTGSSSWVGSSAAGTIPGSAGIGARTGAGGSASNAGGSGASGAVQEGTGGAGPVGSSSARLSRYREGLKSLVEAHKEYPLAARRSGREGSCQRRMVLARDGSLKRVEALTSCGHPFLDNAATRAITSVGKFPPLPDEYPGTEESFGLTITFTLSNR